MAYQSAPERFEAGTASIADAVGLGAALEWVRAVGLENISHHEHDLLEHATSGLLEIPGLRIIGMAPEKAAVLSFVLEGCTPEEAALIDAVRRVAQCRAARCDRTTGQVVLRSDWPGIARWLAAATDLRSRDHGCSHSGNVLMTALGLVLIVAAVVLLLAEAHLSSGGLIAACASVAAVGGVVVLLVAAGAGAVLVLVVGLCAVAAALSLLLLARRRVLVPLRAGPRTGREALVGHVGVVRADGGPEPEVFIDGSLWRAEASPIHHESELHDGDRVVVEGVNGLTLRVRKAEQWELSP
jgi:membrane protein implicated in regulation of membrane protease activity